MARPAEMARPEPQQPAGFFRLMSGFLENWLADGNAPAAAPPPQQQLGYPPQQQTQQQGWLGFFTPSQQPQPQPQPQPPLQPLQLQSGRPGQLGQPAWLGFSGNRRPPDDDKLSV